MKKAKGVVMRTSGNKTVVYTNEGDFLEIPTPVEPPVVGQVIEVSLAPQKPSFKYSILKYAAAAAVLVLALALGIFNPLFGPGAAVASVALDINNGVELFVNKEAKVVKTRDKGDGLGDALGGLDLRGRDVYEAVGLILQEAGAKGVLGKEQNLVLASVVPNGNRGLNVVDEEKLRGIIHDEMLSRNIAGIFMVSEANVEAKRQAENLGMTVNNYLVYDRCRQNGLDVQADAFRGGDMRQALAGANVSLTGLFPGESFEVRPEHSWWQDMEQGRSWNDQGYSHEGSGYGGMERSGYGHESWGMQGEPQMNWNPSDSSGGWDNWSSGGNPSPAQPPGGTAPGWDGRNWSEEPGEGSYETWNSSQQPAGPTGSGGTDGSTVKRKKATGETWENEYRYEGQWRNHNSESEW